MLPIPLRRPSPLFDGSDTLASCHANQERKSELKCVLHSPRRRRVRVPVAGLARRDRAMREIPC